MDLINIEMLKILAFVGIICLSGLFGLISWAFVEWVKRKIQEARINYHIKHRFDGKPVARCWCRDCRGYNNKTHKCTIWNVYKPDDGFCNSSDPIWKRLEEKDDE